MGPVWCSKCRSKMPSEAKFCSSCGTPSSVGPAQISATEPKAISYASINMPSNKLDTSYVYSGMVSSYDSKNGVGVISVESIGEVFVHWRSVKNGQLKTGHAVSLRVTESNDKWLQAYEITKRTNKLVANDVVILTPAEEADTMTKIGTIFYNLAGSVFIIMCIYIFTLKDRNKMTDSEGAASGALFIASIILGVIGWAITSAAKTKKE